MAVVSGRPLSRYCQNLGLEVVNRSLADVREYQGCETSKKHSNGCFRSQEQLFRADQAVMRPRKACS